MASAQQERRDTTTSKRETHVEEHKVPKLTSHFEALVDKSQGGDSATITTTTTGTCPTSGGATAAPIVEEAHKVIRRIEVKDKEEESRAHHGKGGRAHFESIADKVFDDRGAQMRGSSGYQEATTDQEKQRKNGELKQGKTGDAQKQGSYYEVGKFQVKNEEDVKKRGIKEEGEKQTQTPSLEEISGFRQTAQQNSAEAIRAAEERYSKAKELAASTAVEAKESATHGVRAAATYAACLGSKAKDHTLGGVQYMSEKAAPAKETMADTAQRGYVSTKETVAGAGQTAADYSKQAAGQVKSGTMTAAQKAAETGKTVAEKAAETGTTAATKAVETGKTVGVKAMETGKTVGVKAVEVAVEVKDRAAVAGWGTAQYAGEKAVDATRAAAGLVKGVAGYTVDAVVAAKDVVADVGRKTGEYMEESAVAARETMADYAGRKREEAKQDLEAKQRQGQAPLMALVSGGNVREERSGQFSLEQTTRTEKTCVGERKKGGGSGGLEQAGEMVETIVEEGGGVLGAIGETIGEIAQGVVAPPPPVSAVADPTTGRVQDKSDVCDHKSRRSV